jgi:hypothetical protein
MLDQLVVDGGLTAARPGERSPPRFTAMVTDVRKSGADA